MALGDSQTGADATGTEAQIGLVLANVLNLWRTQSAQGRKFKRHSKFKSTYNAVDRLLHRVGLSRVIGSANVSHLAKVLIFNSSRLVTASLLVGLYGFLRYLLPHVGIVYIVTLGVLLTGMTNFRTDSLTISDWLSWFWATLAESNAPPPRPTFPL